jgi:hypothetical protein
MLKLYHRNDPSLRLVPPRVVPTIIRLLEPFSPEHKPAQGFVVFVEHDDELDALKTLVCRNLSESLEGVFYAGDCLVGVVLWGNSGDGVSIVCPDVEHYAVEIATVLKNHLLLKGESL